ncbi:hypothetical protein GCM10019016_011080 [Streptomyces prasinosporus]|uniref:Uncharacterized protein n=1 Tax=Streptomyces prasinosporus TaxID=68256 RepID=A0ABP6TFM9_9ACTN
MVDADKTIRELNCFPNATICETKQEEGGGCWQSHDYLIVEDPAMAARLCWDCTTSEFAVRSITGGK